MTRHNRAVVFYMLIGAAGVPMAAGADLKSGIALLALAVVMLGIMAYEVKR